MQNDKYFEFISILCGIIYEIEINILYNNSSIIYSYKWGNSGERFKNLYFLKEILFLKIGLKFKYIL